MVYKVGMIIVINDSGFVDWLCIVNKFMIGVGDIIVVLVSNVMFIFG